MPSSAQYDTNFPKQVDQKQGEELWLALLEPQIGDADDARNSEARSVPKSEALNIVAATDYNEGALNDDDRRRQTAEDYCRVHRLSRDYQRSLQIDEMRELLGGERLERVLAHDVGPCGMSFHVLGGVERWAAGMWEKLEPLSRVPTHLPDGDQGFMSRVWFPFLRERNFTVNQLAHFDELVCTYWPSELVTREEIALCERALPSRFEEWAKAGHGPGQSPIPDSFERMVYFAGAAINYGMHTSAVQGALANPAYSVLNNYWIVDFRDPYGVSGLVLAVAIALDRDGLSETEKRNVWKEAKSFDLTMVTNLEADDHDYA